MSNEIDWSKAPEGATHWVGGSWPWHKHIGDIAWYWEENLQDWRQLSLCASDVEDEYRKTIVKRPDQAWTGTGLPPVGTVCELSRTNGVNSWTKVEIVYISKSCVVYRTAIEELCDFSYEMMFRPIPTPEQIAAEDREKALDEMNALSPMLDKTWSRKVCAALYDAGYRRVVAK